MLACHCADQSLSDSALVRVPIIQALAVLDVTTHCCLPGLWTDICFSTHVVWSLAEPMLSQQISQSPQDLGRGSCIRARLLCCILQLLLGCKFSLGLKQNSEEVPQAFWNCTGLHLQLISDPALVPETLCCYPLRQLLVLRSKVCEVHLRTSRSRGTIKTEAA